MYAGKFKQADDLYNGVVELHKSMNLVPLADFKTIIGENKPFKDVIALEGYYKNLESMRGKLTAPPKADTPKADTKQPSTLSIDPAKPAEIGDDAGVDEILTAAGLKADELGAQWASEGKLTDAQYAALKAKGIPKGVVNQHMQAAQLAYTTTMQTAQSQAVQIAGGEQQLETLRQWAASGNMPEYLKPLNEQVRTNPALYPQLMEGIKTAYSAKHGAGSLVTGSSARPAASAFTSVKEFEGALARVRNNMATQDDLSRINATDLTKLS